MLWQECLGCVDIECLRKRCENRKILLFSHHHVGIELKVIHHHHHYCFFKYNKLFNSRERKGFLYQFQRQIYWSCGVYSSFFSFSPFLGMSSLELRASCVATVYVNWNLAFDRRQVKQLAFFWHWYFYACLYRFMAAVQKWCLRFVVRTPFLGFANTTTGVSYERLHLWQ
jgi:hypothetical protein